MRAINHALTGAVIGLTVSQPIIAVPAAIVSHFVCDVIPHLGLNYESKQRELRSRGFKLLLYLDAALCGSLVLFLGIIQPTNWWLACICAFAAAAPDFMSINRYISTLRHKPWKPGAFTRFASNIQWFERPIGGVVEVAWLVAAIIILAPLV